MTSIFIKQLEQRNVDFFRNINEIDIRSLTDEIRNHPQRKNIVNFIVSKMNELDPIFVFYVIYDIEEYKKIAEKLAFENNIVLTREEIINALNTSFGFEYLVSNFDVILNEYKLNLGFIFEYLFKNFDKSKPLINKIKKYKDLHIRSLFMIYLAEKQPNYIKLLYENITDYFSAEDANGVVLMDVNDISKVAFALFMNRKYKLFNEVKEYIFKNYPFNPLADFLLFKSLDLRMFPSRRRIREFESDADRYFEKSFCRIDIYENYSKKISKELLEKFRECLLIFKTGNYQDSLFKLLDQYGLTKLIEEYVDKYMDLSVDKTHEFLLEGSTSSCYRIGDFVIKLDRTKWSYENVICPNLYLILPNLEEVFIRDNNGIVKAGIEVQKFLRRDVRNVPKEIFSFYLEELKRLGYWVADTLIDGECGDNTRLLDSYLEAAPNPPDWFKEYPIVLVDRDRVYKLDNQYPHQRKNYY